ncbi:MAG: HAD family hydrolase [Bacteroidales bacterium]|nr:HAD family hydrolase [Bacteroidales bacterium]MDD4209734.1 HAD family hydrolase [Bacteroidales bacterium]
MKTALIIFDLDGTLLNTLDDLADSGNFILRTYGFPEHPVNAYRFFVGDGIRKLIERIIPENKREDSFIEEVKSEFMKHYEIHKYDKTAPYQGIIELLRTIQKRNIKIAVASNKTHEVMGKMMDYYFPGIHFDAVFGQRKKIPPKPDPAVVVDILHKTGIVKEKTLYVGDTSVDMLTAHNAGLKSIGVLWGFRSKEELLQAGADIIIEKPEELLEYC